MNLNCNKHSPKQNNDEQRRLQQKKDQNLIIFFSGKSNFLFFIVLCPKITRLDSKMRKISKPFGSNEMKNCHRYFPHKSKLILYVVVCHLYIFYPSSCVGCCVSCSRAAQCWDWGKIFNIFFIFHITRHFSHKNKRKKKINCCHSILSAAWPVFCHIHS